MLRNITLSADDRLIRKARRKAEAGNSSLNEHFRQWLGQFVGEGDMGEGLKDLLKRFSYANAGRKFSRDEANER